MRLRTTATAKLVSWYHDQERDNVFLTNRTPSIAVPTQYLRQLRRETTGPVALPRNDMMAECLGITESTMSAKRTGARHMRVTELVALADRFGLPVEALARQLASAWNAKDQRKKLRENPIAR